MHLPVFPLPVFLLPGGITRLRIFEPRYKKLVSIASRNNGFALTVFNPDSEQQVSEWAAWVDIIDFFNDKSMLHIDIKAKSLVLLSKVSVDEDGLRFASCEQIAHWSPQSINDFHLALSARLKRIFLQQQEIEQLYQSTNFDSPTWVCSRYLELLPLSMQQKQLFIDPQSFSQAQIFLHTLICGE